MAAALIDFKDGCTFSGYAGSSTVGPITLLGGLYALIVHDTGTPQTALMVNTPSGTYVACGAAVTTNGLTTYQLPPGQYEITTGTGTLLDGALIKVPYRSA